MSMKLKKQFYKDVAEIQAGNVLSCAGELFREEVKEVILATFQGVK